MDVRFDQIDTKGTEADGVGNDGDADPARRHDSLARRRHQRIQDHRRNGLANPNPLLAVTSCMSSDLLELEAQFAEALQKALGQRELTIEDLDARSPAINLFLRISKQAVQTTQLEIHLRSKDAKPRPK